MISNFRLKSKGEVEEIIISSFFLVKIIIISLSFVEFEKGDL